MLRYRCASCKACKKGSSKEHVTEQTSIKPLLVEELHKAESEIIKVAQEQSFAEEIVAMRQSSISGSGAKVMLKTIKPSS